MASPPDAENRRPTQGTGSQKATTPAVPTIVSDQPTITGLDRAIENASPFEVANVRAAITDRAKRPGTFVIEDIFEDTGVYVDHPNRVGALTAALAREGVIIRVGYTKSRRASRAGGVVAVWRGAR
jgi:hypothetical protein